MNDKDGIILFMGLALRLACKTMGKCRYCNPLCLDDERLGNQYIDKAGQEAKRILLSAPVEVKQNA